MTWIAIIIAIPIVMIALPVMLIVEITKRAKEKQYSDLEKQVLTDLGISRWNAVCGIDELVVVKSRQSLENYDEIKFFKENREKLAEAETIIQKKNNLSKKVKKFLESNNYKLRPQYNRLELQIKETLKKSDSYRIKVQYISSAGNNLGERELLVRQYDIERFHNDPSLLMGKGEYNKFLKEQQKEMLSQMHHKYYESVNTVIDYANENRDTLVIKGSKDALDRLVTQLFEGTVNSIKKIKSIDSEEWEIIGNFISRIRNDIEKIVGKNQKILEYYDSENFLKIKDTCEVLMSSQREFNEYITQKVESISQLFGTRVVRSETINEDEYTYIRPYKKTITPFTAEVSATVFASAENAPMEYLVKNFYPNKEIYPEQIQKLHLLLEELETLKEAKQIIENYKAEYQQYLGEVPAFIMENDEVGFYSKLGFATVDESVLAVEYKFSYTSNGGMARRSFSIPMTEDTIVELIRLLESKLTSKAFAKEQRVLMTPKLRTFIKNRDNFTCCSCGNSTHVEPNLLLEIDHIIPIAKGGCTVEENLQTLCWKCNRTKSDKLLV